MNNNNNDINIPVRIAQKKTGKTWINTYTDINPETVYKSLASDIIAKKINKARYIKSIKRVQHYTHVEIIVSYDNNVRSVYYVSATMF